MGIELSAEDKTLLSAEELALLTGSGADDALATMGDEAPQADAAAAGGNVSLEEDGDEQEAKPEGEGAKPTQVTPDTDGEASKAAQDATPEAPPAPKQYTVPEATEMDAKLADIRKRTAELNKAWAGGEKSDEEYSAEQEALMDERDAVNRALAKAEALREINAQHAAEAQARRNAEIEAGIAEVLRANAKNGNPLDYRADKAAAAEFDQVLTALEAMPSYASKTGQELARLAHQQVLLARGLPLQAQPAARAAPQKPPVTLSGLPNAAVPAIDDDLGGQVASMSPMELEEWLATQPDNVQRRVLKRADMLIQ